LNRGFDPAEDVAAGRAEVGLGVFMMLIATVVVEAAGEVEKMDKMDAAADGKLLKETRLKDEVLADEVLKEEVFEDCSEIAQASSVIGKSPGVSSRF
jgi:hypothetical protein